MADANLKTPALSPAAFAALVYLALPAFAFLTQWVVMPAGGALAVMLLGALVYMRRAYGCRVDPAQPWARRILLCLAVAMAWVALGGIGHAVFTNSDWQVRDAVFRDLALTGWPPNYGANGNEVIGTATGASIWGAGGIGLAIGFGFYLIGVVAFAAILLTLVGGEYYREKVCGKSDTEEPC